MTREEIERIGHGDLNAMAKLAATIKPLEQSGRAAGPVLRQFTKAEETPDFIPPGTGISGPTDHTQLAPRTSTTSTHSRIDPDEHGPFTVEIRHDLDEQGYGLSGDYAEVRGQIDVYNRECQARFASVIRQLYPTLPELWNMPQVQGSDAPERWGLGRAAQFDVERKLKTQYQRVAADSTQRRAIRKAAAEIAQGFEVDDSQFRAALRRHNANLAAREILRDHSNDPTYKLALQGLIGDENVPAAERENAKRELQALA